MADLGTNVVVCQHCDYQAASLRICVQHEKKSLGMHLLRKYAQKYLTNVGKTNDHVDRFEMSPGRRHMNSKQGVHPSTQEEHLSPL